MAKVAGFIISFIFGFSFLMISQALKYLGAFHLLGLRFALAVVTFTVLQILGIVKIDLRGKKYGRAFLLALFQPVLYFVFETFGLKMTTTSQAGIIIALIPAFAMGLGMIFLHEKLSALQSICIFASVMGTILIVIMGGQNGESHGMLGSVILLGAVASQGLYGVLSRKISAYYSSAEITFIMMWSGAIVFNGVAVYQQIRTHQLSQYFKPLLNLNVLLPVIYLGILSSVAAYFLFNYMMARMAASRGVAIIYNLTTIVCVIAGITIKKEPFSWVHFIGLMFIIFGIWGTAKINKSDGLNKGVAIKQTVI